VIKRYCCQPQPPLRRLAGPTMVANSHTVVIPILFDILCPLHMFLLLIYIFFAIALPTNFPYRPTFGSNLFVLMHLGFLLFWGLPKISGASV
jgi:hypothetical protein